MYDTRLFSPLPIFDRKVSRSLYTSRWSGYRRMLLLLQLCHFIWSSRLLIFRLPHSMLGIMFIQAKKENERHHHHLQESGKEERRNSFFFLAFLLVQLISSSFSLSLSCVYSSNRLIEYLSSHYLAEASTNSSDRLKQVSNHEENTFPLYQGKWQINFGHCPMQYET